MIVQKNLNLRRQNFWSGETRRGHVATHVGLAAAAARRKRAWPGVFRRGCRGPSVGQERREHRGALM